MTSLVRLTVLLTLAFAARPSLAFVCPQETLAAAPVNLPEGARCGGTCNTHGTCAHNLMCTQDETVPPNDDLQKMRMALLGTRASGTCTKAKPELSADKLKPQFML